MGGGPLNEDALSLVWDDVTVRGLVKQLIERSTVDIYVNHDIGGGLGLNNKGFGEGLLTLPVPECLRGECLEGIEADIVEAVKDCQADEGGESDGSNAGEAGESDDEEGDNAKGEFVAEHGQLPEVEFAENNEHDEVEVEQTNDGKAEEEAEDLFIAELGQDTVEGDVDEEIEQIRYDLLRKKKGKLLVTLENDDGVLDKNGQLVGPDSVEKEVNKEGKVEGYESDYMNSDDPGDYVEAIQSDDEVPEPTASKYPKYNDNCVIPLWEMGLRFDDADEFREAVTKYALAKGVLLEWVKSDKSRVRVKCQDGCPWLLLASKDKKTKSFMVKTYVSQHICYRSNKNSMCTVKYLKKKLKDRILENPKLQIEVLRNMVKREFKVYATYWMVRRARKTVLRENREKYVEEYADLWAYAAELITSNPGSTVSIQVHKDDAGVQTFFRMYVCFNALKEGWKVGCRPFIGVDGTFLKTERKGILLVAVGRDANNQMFPVAWAIVENENSRSWRWFLTKLFADLDHPTGEGLTVMSDQHTALLKVMAEDFPQVEYRMCARHIYSNWQKKWKGDNMKIQFWRCIRSTYKEQLDDRLEELEAMDEGSKNDLLATPVKHWSKAYFQTLSKCDVSDNNMAEAFNAWIKDARGMDIITLNETLGR